MWKNLTTAFAFLTIVRLPLTSRTPLTPQDFAGSYACFPLVGLFVGLCTLLPAYFLASAVPSLILAALTVSLSAALTRSLHLDGIADLADGVGGGHTPERRLQIMKDSRIGSFGAIALCLTLLIKTAAIQSLILQSNWAAFLLAPALSRCAIVIVSHRTPYARPEGGLGKAFLDNMTLRQPFIASLFTVAATLALAPHLFYIYLPVLFAFAWLWRRLSRRWLGGITGDVLGAVSETMELLFFVLAASSLPRI